MDGYAWRPAPARGERDRRGCIGSHTLASAARVAAVLQGRPIDQAWALRCLITGDDGTGRIVPGLPGIVAHLWPDPCPGCGASHLERATEWRRCALAIHPGALEELRRTDPPWHLLRNLDVPRRRPHTKGTRGLPVRLTPEATERAQEAWSIELRARMAEPYRRPRRRTTLPANRGSLP